MAQATHPVKTGFATAGAGSATTGAVTDHAQLGALLVSQGHCDAKTLERARGVAAESGSGSTAC